MRLTPPPAGISPFARLNLRRNPFGEPPAEDLPALVVGDFAEMARWLAGGRRGVQITGECGRGKTALLAGLGACWGEAPYVYLPEDGPLPPIPGSPRLRLDEGQRLPPRARRHLFRRVAAIAVATHEDLADELAAAGLEVRHLTLEGLDAPRLAAILDRRLAWVRRGPGPVPRPTPDAVDRLVAHFGDDLRAMLDHLYDVYQDLAAGRTGRREGLPPTEVEDGEV